MVYGLIDGWSRGLEGCVAFACGRTIGPTCWLNCHATVPRQKTTTLTCSWPYYCDIPFQSVCTPVLGSFICQCPIPWVLSVWLKVLWTGRVTSLL